MFVCMYPRYVKRVLHTRACAIRQTRVHVRYVKHVLCTQVHAQYVKHVLCTLVHAHSFIQYIPEYQSKFGIT